MIVTQIISSASPKASIQSDGFGQEVRDFPLKFEAGTANFVGAIGLGEAIAYLEGLDLEAVELHEKELLRYAEQSLSTVAGLRIYGTTQDKCSIVSFNVDGVHHYDLGMILGHSIIHCK